MDAHHGGTAWLGWPRRPCAELAAWRAARALPVLGADLRRVAGERRARHRRAASRVVHRVVHRGPRRERPRPARRRRGGGRRGPGRGLSPLPVPGVGAEERPALAVRRPRAPGRAARLAEPVAQPHRVLLEPRSGATLRLRVRFLQVSGGRSPTRTASPSTRSPSTAPRASPGTRPSPVRSTPPCPSASCREPDHDRAAPLPASETPSRSRRRRHGARRLRPATRRSPGTPWRSRRRLPGPYGALRLRLDVVNNAAGSAGHPAEDVLRSSLISAHTVLGLAPARSCPRRPAGGRARPWPTAVNVHGWPVLAGPGGQHPPGAGVADHPATTTPSWPPRAPPTSSTAPRTTRSSACAPSPSPTTRSARPAPPTPARPACWMRWTPWVRRCSSACTAR